MEINITILFQISVFLLLLGWLSRFLFKPLLVLVDERERRISGARAEAKAALAAASQRKNQVEERIIEARTDARATLEGLKAQDLEFYHKIAETARQEAREEIKRAHKEIGLEAQKIGSVLRGEIDKLADSVLSKIVELPRPGATRVAPKLESKSAI